MEGPNNFETFFSVHIKPTKGLRENIYDLKYSLVASLIKIVDEDGKKKQLTNRQKQTKRSSGGIK